MPSLLDALRSGLLMDRLQSDNPSDAMRLANRVAGRPNPPQQPQIGMMPSPPMGVPGLQNLEARSLLQRLGQAQLQFKLGKAKTDMGLQKMIGTIQASRNPGLESVVHEAGGRWKGLVHEGLPEPYIVFDDPITQSTHYMPKSELSRNNIMKLLGESRSKFGGGPAK